jgi:hypothetical protein
MHFVRIYFQNHGEIRHQSRRPQQHDGRYTIHVSQFFIIKAVLPTLEALL